jgi:hypothetical protein
MAKRPNSVSKEDKTESQEIKEKRKAVTLLINARKDKRIQTVYSYISNLSCTYDDQILVCGTYKRKRSFNIRLLDIKGK